MKAPVHYLADGAGNRFLLVDALAGPAPSAPAADAPAVCRQHGVDGLLLLAAPEGDGAARMILFNADGSRPEACGNGLRCVAQAAVLGGHVTANAFRIETDAGPRGCRVSGGEVEVELGPVRLQPGTLELDLDGRRVTGVRADVGNPHFVLREDVLSDARVLDLGPRLCDHGQFPDGTNVEFCVVAEEHLILRVHERGVGETQACGTGAAAAAAVAVERWGLRWPVRVELPGGTLRIALDDAGHCWLSGPTRLQRM